MKLSRRARRKARKRAKLHALLAETTEPRSKVGEIRPSALMCYSQVCAECGKVWVSAVHPIEPNRFRQGRRDYVCRPACK